MVRPNAVTHPQGEHISRFVIFPGMMESAVKEDHVSDANDGTPLSLTVSFNCPARGECHRSRPFNVLADGQTMNHVNDSAHLRLPYCRRNCALGATERPSPRGIRAVLRVCGPAGRVQPPFGEANMHIKVHGGTVRHDDPSLCTGCGHSTIIRGETADQRIVSCHAAFMHPRPIPFRVTSCTAYVDGSQPPYSELVRLAWILRPYGSKKRPAGFVRGEDLTDKEFVEMLHAGPDGGT